MTVRQAKPPVPPNPISSLRPWVYLLFTGPSVPWYISSSGALLTCTYLGRPIASLGWQLGQTRYQVISY